MRQKVFLNESSLSPMHNGREMQKTTNDLFHWANPKTKKTRRTKKGARIKIADFSEWLANRKRCAQRKGARTEDAARQERRWRYANNHASFSDSEWLLIQGGEDS